MYIYIEDQQNKKIIIVQFLHLDIDLFIRVFSYNIKFILKENKFLK